MKKLVNVLAAAAIAAPLWVVPADAGPKNLPPAFGTELVPDQQSQEYKGPSAEIEEPKDEGEERAARHPARQRGGGGGRGGRVRIQLDGDEDGGGGDALDGDF